MRDPTWWPLFRRMAVFLLGCAVIIDALVEGSPIGYLIVGLLMVGVLPIDDLISLATRHRNRREDQ
jgi:hypothetical protein